MAQATGHGVSGWHNKMSRKSGSAGKNGSACSKDPRNPQTHRHLLRHSPSHLSCWSRAPAAAVAGEKKSQFAAGKVRIIVMKMMQVTAARGEDVPAGAGGATRALAAVGGKKGHQGVPAAGVERKIGRSFASRDPS